MARTFPIYPSHPERVCWGCDRYCPSGSLSCGNGSDRTPHPIELLGEDWLEYGDWGIEKPEAKPAKAPAPAAAPAAAQPAPAAEQGELQP